jgi:hypothetical protein
MLRIFRQLTMLFLLVVRAVAAQEVSESLQDSRVIEVRTNIDSALVSIDGKPVGKTPLVLDSLEVGKHVIVIQHPDKERWLAPAIQDTIEAGSEGGRVLFYRLDIPLLVQSEPFNAEVYEGNQYMGTTPLLLRNEEPLRVLSLRKTGYAPAELALDPAGQRMLFVKLDKLADQGEEHELVVRRGENGDGASLPLIVAGASSVVFGAGAAYFKVKADNSYGKYLATGDPNSRSETRRFDTAAGILLAATQLGLGVFAYLLLSP